MVPLVLAPADQAAADRVPKGATIDQAEAGEIARDGGRATRARDYWRDTLSTLDADPFGSGDPVAFKVIGAVPHIAMDSSPDAAIARRHIIAPGDHAPASGLISLSGCCLSGAEIARFTKAGTDLGDVLGAVRKLDDAAKGAPPRRDSEVPVRAARELYDAVRRVSVAQLSASPGRVTPAEALALHRQEGAFVVTPDAQSYAHAPLVRTQPGTCRIGELLFASEDVEGTARPGFNLVFRLPRVSESEASQVPELMRLQFLIVNAVVLGGLDIVASTRAAPGAPGDELTAIVHAALQAGGPLAADSTARLFGLNPLLETFATAVAMIELETRNRVPDEVEEFIEAVRRRLGELSAAHNTELRSSPSGGVDVMAHSDGARDVRRVLRLQCDWYGSRTDPDTLRAWTGRSQTVGRRPGFSPFMTYLRFNLGDRSFITVLLRTAVALREIEKRWSRRDAGRWPGDFREALRSNAVTTPTFGGRTPYERALREWLDLGQPDQHAWKVAWLIDRLHARGSYPAWAPRSAPAESAAT